MFAIQAGTETIICGHGAFVSLSPIPTVIPSFLEIAWRTPATYLISSLVFAMMMIYVLGSLGSTRIIDGTPKANVFPDPFYA